MHQKPAEPVSPRVSKVCSITSIVRIGVSSLASYEYPYVLKPPRGTTSSSNVSHVSSLAPKQHSPPIGLRLFGPCLTRKDLLDGQSNFFLNDIQCSMYSRTYNYRTHKILVRLGSDCTTPGTIWGEVPIRYSVQ